VDINGDFVRVLHGNECHRYLGRFLSLSAPDRIQRELQNRKNHAWGSFHKHKKVILNHHVSLAKRLKFFDMCVSPSMLFALVSLPLTRAQIEGIDILQRKMLRRIVGWRRIENEPWDTTMSRMRDRLDNARTLYNWKTWSYRLARDQWRFAVHLARSTSTPLKATVLEYTSSAVNDSDALYVPHRLVGRPRTKWDDCLKGFFVQHFPARCLEHWSIILKSADITGLEESFIEFCSLD